MRLVCYLAGFIRKKIYPRSPYDLEGEMFWLMYFVALNVIAVMFVPLVSMFLAFFIVGYYVLHYVVIRY